MKDPLGLAQFKIPLGKLASSQVFRTRAGFQLSYRLYPSWSEDLIFLFHGMGADSRYLAVLASEWASQGFATVVTPDFRGHGASFGASDEINQDQLEQDFEELFIHLRMERSVRRVFVSGHSLGGGFALRLMSSEISSRLSGALAIAPHLPALFQTNTPDFGGWVSLVGDQVVVHRPEAFRTGQEKLSYSINYLNAVLPATDFLEKLNSEHETAIVIGERDQVSRADKMAAVFAGNSRARCVIVPEADHFSIVMASVFVKTLTELLKKTFLLV